MSGPKSKRVEPTKSRTIRVPESVLRRVSVRLAREDRTFNAVAVRLLEEWAADATAEMDPVDELIADARAFSTGKRASGKPPVPFTTDQLHEADE